MRQKLDRSRKLKVVLDEKWKVVTVDQIEMKCSCWKSESRQGSGPGSHPEEPPQFDAPNQARLGKLIKAGAVPEQPKRSP